MCSVSCHSFPRPVSDPHSKWRRCITLHFTYEDIGVRGMNFVVAHNHFVTSSSSKPKPDLRTTSALSRRLPQTKVIRNIEMRTRILFVLIFWIRKASWKRCHLGVYKGYIKTYLIYIWTKEDTLQREAVRKTPASVCWQEFKFLREFGLTGLSGG